MERWLSRWAPLASVPAAGLLIAAFVSGDGNSPDNNAAVGQIVRFYTAHATGQKASAVLGALALVFVVLFTLALSGRVRDKGASGWLANGAAVGACAARGGVLASVRLVVTSSATTSSSCCRPQRRPSTC